MKTFLQINISIFIIFFFSACKEREVNINLSTISSSFLEGKIILIKDGDTFKIYSNGKEKTIRLEHIDCPEKKQPFGDKAKQFAYGLCFGKIVTVRTTGKTDRNKRIIGEVILQDGTNINQELIKNGLAWHFKKYSTDSKYAELENIAKRSRVGLWSDKHPIAPWLWRQ